jgi:hypothetical protein
MTQRELIIHCFTTKGFIKNKDFADKYQAYTGRNRVTAASMKAYWAERGMRIEHFFGEEWAENGWQLVPIQPVTIDQSGQTAFA